MLPPPGVRLYHTATSLSGGGAVVYGGRSSPLNPVKGLFKATVYTAGPSGRVDSEDTVKLHVEQIVYTGDPPLLRWRHTASILSHKGEKN